MIHSPEGVLTLLIGIAAGFFWLEKRTGWTLFKYFPPLIFIYATPIILSNTGVLAQSSPVYSTLRNLGLPAVICLMLISVDVGKAVRILGRGVLVMLSGSLGIVVGGVCAYLVVHRWLDSDAWMGYGALAGSWIGGTGNMAAVQLAIKTPDAQFGLATLTDNLVYVVWLPIMIGCRAFGDRFNRWAKVPADRIAKMEEAAASETTEEQVPMMRDYLFLGLIAAVAIWFSRRLSEILPEVGDMLTTSVWFVLVLTAVGVSLSFTPARRIPGSHNLAMALLYVYVARVGAMADLAGFSQAPAFVLGGFIWIFIHGLFCVGAAKLLRVDIHSVAIASAANVGGAASAPVVAAAHRHTLVPVSVLMALLGYAYGTPLAIGMARLCEFFTRSTPVG